jgi:acetyltransferase-like isoleucine patch superfamily enzyme
MPVADVETMDLVIFGAGQIAEVAMTYIDAHGPYRVVGFTVDAAYVTAPTFHGLPVVAWEELETRFPPDAVRLIGPLSYRRLNEFRRDRHQEGKARGYTFASFIHPGAHVYAESIGENAFILEANVVQPFVRIGVGAMIWSHNHIGHHSTIGDYCFMASGTTIGSTVRIGDRCFIAGMVGIEPGSEIGSDCIVLPKALIDGKLAAGSVVRRGGTEASNIPSSRLKNQL